MIDKPSSRRGSRGYRARWNKVRMRVLRGNPVCVVCERKGVTSVATEVDHIVPLADGGARFARANLQALCRPCHELKTAFENRVRNRGGHWVVVDEGGRLVSGRS